MTSAMLLSLRHIIDIKKEDNQRTANRWVTGLPLWKDERMDYARRRSEKPGECILIRDTGPQRENPFEDSLLLSRRKRLRGMAMERGFQGLFNDGDTLLQLLFGDRQR